MCASQWLGWVWQSVFVIFDKICEWNVCGWIQCIMPSSQTELRQFSTPCHSSVSRTLTSDPFLTLDPPKYNTPLQVRITSGDQKELRLGELPLTTSFCVDCIHRHTLFDVLDVKYACICYSAMFFFWESGTSSSCTIHMGLLKFKQYFQWHNIKWFKTVIMNGSILECMTLFFWLKRSNVTIVLQTDQTMARNEGFNFLNRQINAEGLMKLTMRN